MFSLLIISDNLTTTMFIKLSYYILLSCCLIHRLLFASKAYRLKPFYFWDHFHKALQLSRKNYLLTTSVISIYYQMEIACISVNLFYIWEWSSSKVSTFHLFDWFYLCIWQGLKTIMVCLLEERRARKWYVLLQFSIIINYKVLMEKYACSKLHKGLIYSLSLTNFKSTVLVVWDFIDS